MWLMGVFLVTCFGSVVTYEFMCGKDIYMWLGETLEISECSNLIKGVREVLSSITKLTVKEPAIKFVGPFELIA